MCKLIKLLQTDMAMLCDRFTDKDENDCFKKKISPRAVATYRSKKYDFDTSFGLRRLQLSVINIYHHLCKGSPLNPTCSRTSEM